MFESLADEINNLIEDAGRDLKFKINDKILPINFDCSPCISYDYLLLESGNEYSFLNPEINNITSEDFPNLSDAQIYFDKIKQVCKTKFDNLTNNSFFFQTINPNRNLKNITDFIFSQKLQASQIPQFIEIRLYTNKKSAKAPRVFGFVGNANIIYILFYDPFHKIYNAIGKI